MTLLYNLAHLTEITATAQSTSWAWAACALITLLAWPGLIVSIRLLSNILWLYQILTFFLAWLDVCRCVIAGHDMHVYLQGSVLWRRNKGCGLHVFLWFLGTADVLVCSYDMLSFQIKDKTFHVIFCWCHCFSIKIKLITGALLDCWLKFWLGLVPELWLFLWLLKPFEFQPLINYPKSHYRDGSIYDTCI